MAYSPLFFETSVELRIGLDFNELIFSTIYLFVYVIISLRQPKVNSKKSRLKKGIE